MLKPKLPYSSGLYESQDSTPASERRPNSLTLPATTKTLVKIVCSPGGDALEATHRFIENYAQNRFSTQVAQRVSLAAYELLANAFNFGLLSADVTIELATSESRVEVSVTNDAIAARIEMLSAHVEKLSHDAAGTMMEEMRRSVGGVGARAMLGLARIAHEAGLDLVVRVDGGRRVTVKASGRA
jgi:hypothetical protein